MLFNPIKIRDVSFRNRIVVSPMCQYSSVDGFANDWHSVHLGSRAVGGAALIFTEAAAVEARGRISPADLGLYQDEHILPLKRITQFITAHGGVSGVQLAHAGRKASTAAPWKGGQSLDASDEGWRPVLAPSALAFSEGSAIPEAMTPAQIAEVVEAFGRAAERALAAGFQVVEIHAAHGYLIHEFLSPVTNHRTDDYGGSFANRIRFLEQIVKAVRRHWPARLPLFVRLSATDWLEGPAWDIDQSVELARVLKREEVDLVDCSSGGIAPHVRIPTGPGYQTGFSERIRKETGILTGAVGLITTAAQAKMVLESGKADMVFLARQLLRDPYWPLHAAAELKADAPWPVQYQRAVS